MEEDITIDWETFVKSQLHWIRVVYLKSATIIQYTIKGRFMNR